MHVSVVEYEEEEMSKETHAYVPTLHTKNFLTVIGDHLDGSSIHYGIDVQQFHYYGVHKIGSEFDTDMLMNIGKNWDEEDNDEFRNTFQN